MRTGDGPCPRVTKSPIGNTTHECFVIPSRSFAITSIVRCNCMNSLCAVLIAPTLQACKCTINVRFHSHSEGTAGWIRIHPQGAVPVLKASRSAAATGETGTDRPAAPYVATPGARSSAAGCGQRGNLCTRHTPSSSPTSMMRTVPRTISSAPGAAGRAPRKTMIPIATATIATGSNAGPVLARDCESIRQSSNGTYRPVYCAYCHQPFPCWCLPILSTPRRERPCASANDTGRCSHVPAAAFARARDLSSSRIGAFP